MIVQFLLDSGSRNIRERIKIQAADLYLLPIRTNGARIAMNSPEAIPVDFHQVLQESHWLEKSVLLE